MYIALKQIDERLTDGKLASFKIGEEVQGLDNTTLLDLLAKGLIMKVASFKTFTEAKHGKLNLR